MVGDQARQVTQFQHPNDSVVVLSMEARVGGARDVHAETHGYLYVAVSYTEGDLEAAFAVGWLLPTDKMALWEVLFRIPIHTYDCLRSPPSV